MTRATMPDLSLEATAKAAGWSGPGSPTGARHSRPPRHAGPAPRRSSRRPRMPRRTAPGRRHQRRRTCQHPARRHSRRHLVCSPRRPWSASEACSTSPSPSGSSGASVLARRNPERHDQRPILVAEARGHHPTPPSEAAPGACPASEGGEVRVAPIVEAGRRSAARPPTFPVDLSDGSSYSGVRRGGRRRRSASRRWTAPGRPPGRHR